MMGGGGNSISVPVNLKLEVLQSSLTQLQNLLNKLTPNSKGFKDLQNIVTSITGNMEKLSAQTSKPFINQSQFSQAEKTIENIEEGFSRAQLIANRIEFSDLKLDSSQMAEIENFNQQIEQLRNNFESLKETEKVKLLGDVDFSGLKDMMNPNTLTGSFDEVIKQITKKSKELENAYFSAKQNLENLEKSRDLGQAAEKIQGGFMKDGDILPDFEQYFRKLTTSGGIGFKSGQKTAFKEYLIQAFSLDKTEVEELFKKTAAEIQAELAKPDGLLANAVKAGTDAKAKLPEARRKENEAKVKADTGQKGLEAAARAQEEVANGADQLNQKTEQVTRGLQGVQQAAVDAARAEGNLSSSQNQLTSQFQQFRQELANASNGMAKAQSQMNTFNGIKNTIVNFLGFNQVLNITRNAVRNAINHIKELDTTMNGIAIVTNMTTADLWNQVEAYSAMAQNFGVTIQGAYEVSKIYYQAGYDTNEVLTLTNETLKLSKISGLDYATTTDYMMTAMRGFKLEMEDASRVVDVYSNLAANTAVSQQELAEAMTRTASSLQSVGATFEESSAMIATMVAVTRESANNIGSALKSIASRYGELKSDPTKLFDAEGEAMDFNKVDTALKSVGISLQTTDHQFRDLTDVIVELAGKWDTLDSAQQRYIATQFAGNRQQSRFLALVSNIDLLQENIANAQNSEDIGTLQAMKAMDSLESKINQVQVAYQQFYTTIGIEDAWKGFLDITKNVIDNLNNLPKVFGKIPIAAVVMISNLITLIKALLQHGMSNLATIWEEALRQAQESAGTAGERTARNWLDKIIQGIRNGKKEVAQAQENAVNNNVAGQTNNAEASKISGKAGWNKASNALSGVSAALTSISMLLDQTSDKGRKAAASLMGIGGALKGVSGIIQLGMGNIFGGITSLVAGVIEIISALSIKEETAAERAERLAEQAEKASLEAKKLKAETNTLNNGIEKLKQLEQLRHTSTEATEEYKSAVDELAETFPGLIQGFDDAGNAIIDIREAEAYLAAQRKITAKATYDAADAERESAQADVDAKEQEAIAAIKQARKVSVNDRFNFINSIANNIRNELLPDGANYNAKDVEEDEKYLEYLNNLLGFDIDDNPDKYIKNIGEAERALMNVPEYSGFIAGSLSNYKDFWNLVNSISENNDSLTNIDLAHQALTEYENILSNFDLDLESGEGALIRQAKEDLERFLKIQQDLKISGYKSANATKKAIAEYQNSYEYFNSGFEDIFSTTLFNLAPDLAWSENQIADQEVLFRTFNDEVWKKLTKEQQEELTKMVNDSYHYSSTDIVDKIKEYLKTTDLPKYIQEAIEKAYLPNNEELIKDLSKLSDSAVKVNNKTSNYQIQKKLKNELSDKIKQSRDGLYEFTESERRFYSQAFDVSNLYAKAGLKMPDFSGLYSEIEKLPISLQDEILSNGFKTVEGLNKTIEAIKKANPDFDTKPFENIRDTLINNLQLSISSLLDSFTSEVADISKKVSGMTSGLEIADVQDLIKSSKDFDKGKLSISDFTVVNGKLVTTAEKAQAYWQDYLENNSKTIGEYQDKLDALNEIISAENLPQLKDTNQKLIAEALGSPDEYAKFFDKNGNLLEGQSEAFYKAITNSYDNMSANMELLTQAQTWATQMLEDEQKLAEGDYKEFANDLKQFAKEKFGNTTGKDLRNRNAQEKLHSAYSALISDVLSKGFDNINLADYEGLINKGEGIKLEGNYQDFIKEYIDYAGKTIQEINQITIEAIEKDNKIAVADAVKDIDFYTKEIAYASLDTLKQIADYFDVSINTLFEGSANKQGQYKLTADALDKIKEYPEMMADSLYSVVNSIVDYFNKGLSGSLGVEDTGVFEQMLEQYQIDLDLNWIKTSQGLKLSTESAISLYNELQKIDSLQGQIAFKDLRKYLEDNNEHYKTAVSLNEHIANLRKEIASLDEKTNSTRIKQYQEELDLALEINKARLIEDDKSWDFFNADLQEGFSNPISLWKSYAEAEKWAAEVNKKGYADWEQALQILPMINRAAGAAGKDIVYFGQTLDGTDKSLTKFYETLEASGAVQRIDGSVVLNLKALGTSVVEGADALGEDFDTGIKKIAEEQVKLLDAEIRMLEGFAAMENLDLDLGPDGIFNADDLKLDENNKKITKGLSDFADNIGVDAELIIEAYKKLLEADPEKAFNFIKTLQDQLADWQTFESADLILKALGLTDEQIKQIEEQIKKRNEAIEKGEKPPEDLKNWTTTTTTPEIQLSEEEDIEHNKYVVDAAKAREEKMAEDARRQAEQNAAQDAYEEALAKAKEEEEERKKAEAEAAKKAKDAEDAAKKAAEETAAKEAENAQLISEAGEKIDSAATIIETNTTQESASIQLFDTAVNKFASAVDLITEGGSSKDEEQPSTKPNNYNINSQHQETFYDEDDVIKAEQEAAEAAAEAARIAKEEAEKAGYGQQPSEVSNQDYARAAGEAAGREARAKHMAEVAAQQKKAEQEAAEAAAAAAEQEAAAAEAAKKAAEIEAKKNAALQIQGSLMPEIPTNLDGKPSVEGKIETVELSQKGVTLPGGKTTYTTSDNEPKSLGQTALDAFEKVDSYLQEQETVSEILEALLVPLASAGIAPILAGLSYGGLIDSEGTGKWVKDNLGLETDFTDLEAAKDLFTQSAEELPGTVKDGYENIVQFVRDANSVIVDTIVNAATSAYEEVKSNAEKILYPEHTPDEKIGGTEELDEAFEGLSDNAKSLVQLMVTSEDTNSYLEALGKAIVAVTNEEGDATPQLALFNNELQSIGGTISMSVGDVVSAFNFLAEKARSVTFPTGENGAGEAKGNVALAKGTKTLMGELGPELYVANGRYYVAGQNGAEFVNLPDDAIVFNHLQTKRLLGNGSTSRGTAIHGENKATAYAAGNFTGPAKASASATLAQLKQLRSMWASIANASAQDLANAGGGGGGGDDDKQLKNVTAEIQRWYNLLRQIDKLEKDISYQEQLRAKIESDRVVNGRAMYSTYKEELKYLDQEIARNKELANLQKSWYDHKREELANSAYGKIFTYDENGLQQYVGDSRPGSGLGLDILEHLTQMKVTGEAVGAAKNVKTQLDYLQSVGFDIEALKFNKDGTTIDTKKLKGDKLDEAYVQMMQNFWDSVDGWRDELDGIYDSYHEQLENVISNEEKRNGLLQEIIDNQLSVEQSVYKAIEEREQAAIDRAQEERDALSDSAEKFLDGLSEQLDKERNMYDRNQSSEELNKLRRQLAILQRSGGSASQIRELQNQITSQEQDAYFQAQQDQIDAIKEASDAQLERLDHQIDIMTETLEYQKEHGLLWKEVYDVMAGTPEQIQQFIQENTPDFQSNSALQVMEDLRKLKGEIELWISSRDDNDNPIYTDAGHNWSSYVEASQNRYKDILTDELLAQAKAAFDAEYVRSSDPNAAGAAADAILNKKLEEYNKARGIGTEGSSGGSETSTSSSGNGSGKYWNIRYPDGKQAGKRFTSKAQAEAWLNQQKRFATSIYQAAMDDLAFGGPQKDFDDAKKELDRLKKATIFSYSHGGLADYTGLAMVHGSKTRPEAFLNAEQTAMWKNDILGKRNSLTSLLLDFTGALSDLADSNTYNTINRGEAINIDKAEVIMNVGSIANDYDARRAGESALEQMLNIARKTGTRGVSRG